MTQRPRPMPSGNRHPDGCDRPVRAAAALAAVALWLLTGACAPGRRADDVVHAAGADRKVKLELSSGPVEELIVVRDTDERFVVSGLCFFPDGTRLSVALYDSAGTFRARTVPTVDQALFRSLPLGGDDGGGWPGGRYVIELSAEFAVGAQPPAVLRAVGDGREFRGDGMTVSRQGHPAYARRFQVRL